VKSLIGQKEILDDIVSNFEETVDNVFEIEKTSTILR